MTSQAFYSNLGGWVKREIDDLEALLLHGVVSHFFSAQLALRRLLKAKYEDLRVMRYTHAHTLKSMLPHLPHLHDYLYYCFYCGNSEVVEFLFT